VRTELDIYVFPWYKQSVDISIRHFRLFLKLFLSNTLYMWDASINFPLKNGIVSNVRRRVPLVEQELLTLTEHISSHPVFSRVRVVQSLVYYTEFCRLLFSFCPFSFGHCFVCVFFFFFDFRLSITPLVSSNLS